jgi:segregation and condensation protein B
MEDKEAKSILEAVLFISGEPITISALKNILEINEKEVERIAGELIQEYRLRNTGLLIVEVAGGVQMVTNPSCAPWVKKLLTTSIPAKLSHQSLETLAIVAYKQPIIKAEIESIRGVNSDGVLRTLLERRLIKILGRKEVPGRPLLYGTTREFLQYFGLNDLSELPTLKEFYEVDSADQLRQSEPDSSMQEIEQEEQKQNP